LQADTRSTVDTKELGMELSGFLLEYQEQNANIINADNAFKEL